MLCHNSPEFYILVGGLTEKEFEYNYPVENNLKLKL